MTLSAPLAVALAAALALLAATGPASADAAAAELLGTATYRERMALPSGAVLEVVLEDASRTDAPAPVIARQAQADPGAPPFAFALPYDPAALDPRAQYNLRARITLGDELLFVTDTAFPALTEGAPARPELLLVRVAGTADAPALLGTDWRILGFGETVLGPGEPGREPILRLDPAEPRFAATIGCNRMMGGYALDGAALAFSQVASTMMACPPPLDAQERFFAAALAAVTGWRVEGGTLELVAGDAPIMRLEAVPAP
jgi:putative lipoprotein